LQIAKSHNFRSVICFSAAPSGLRMQLDSGQPTLHDFLLTIRNTSI